MGIVDRIMGALRRITTAPAGAGGSAWWSLPGLAGIRGVEDRGAWMSVSWIACEVAKARPMSSLPAHVYRRDGEWREELHDHPLSRILRTRWNPFTTATEGMRWLVMARDTLGTAYVFVRYDRDGQPRELWPIRGAEVAPKWSERMRRAYYEVGPGDQFVPPGTYQSWQVLAFKSPVSQDGGLTGASLAKMAAETIGLDVDLGEFYRRLVTNGNHFPGYLQTEQALLPADFDRLAAELRGTSGVLEAGKVRVFDKGLSYHSVDMTMKDMNIVEQQTWVLQQVCRVTSVPPQKVYDLSRATYSNVEQSALGFVQDTLRPEVSDVECVLNCMLADMGQPDVYVKFDLNGLQRGDFKGRMDGYTTGIYAGFFTRADVRSWEDLPPLPGLDRPLQPVAYAVVGEDGEPRQPAAAPSDEAAAAIHADMASRIRARARDNPGDPGKARAFAARVLAPWAEARAIAGLPYDMEGDIDTILEGIA